MALIRTESDSTWTHTHTHAHTLNRQKKEVMPGVAVQGLALKVKHERALWRKCSIQPPWHVTEVGGSRRGHRKAVLLLIPIHYMTVHVHTHTNTHICTHSFCPHTHARGLVVIKAKALGGWRSEKKARGPCPVLDPPLDHDGFERQRMTENKGEVT